MRLSRYMDPLERLTDIFERFPGIGPRQAARFVQFLLRSSPTLRSELIDSLGELSQSVHQCPECMRFHSGERPVCSICGNHNRDQSIVAVVSSDTDIAALERSGSFRGRYFVLGGLLSLASDKPTGLRFRELKKVMERPSLREIVLAFPANPEGDATAARTRDELSEVRLPTIVVTTLGRGLSTGSELEYADAETLRSALDNRR